MRMRALAILVLLGFMFAIIDAGMLFWTYVTLENGITEATRFAATNQTLADPGNPGNQLSRVDSIKLTMRTESNGIPIADGEFVFFNITKGTADPGAPNDIIKITVNHPFTLPFPILFPGAGRNFDIHVSSTMKNEPV